MLSVRVSMSICLVFTVGMAWLIDLATDPMLGLAATTTATAAQVEREASVSEFIVPAVRTRTRGSRTDGRVGQFSVASIATRDPAQGLQAAERAPAVAVAMRSEFVAPPLVEPVYVPGAEFGRATDVTADSDATSDLLLEAFVPDSESASGGPQGQLVRHDVSSTGFGGRAQLADRDPALNSTRGIVTLGAEAAARPAYVVKRGDSLSKIAHRKLGDRNRWREISVLNNLRNPNKLMAGMQLQLPD